MKKIFCNLCPFFILLVLLLALPTSVQASTTYKNQLVKDDSGTHYYNSKGKLTKNSLITLKNKKYYFDSKGIMVSGKLFSFKGKTYYADSKGVLAKNKFVTLGGKRYFFDSSCARKTGWITYKKHKYYCPSSGAVYKKMWKKIGSKTYYFTNSTYIATNSWVDGYYVNSKGYRTGKRLSDSALKTNATKKTIKMKNIKQNPELPTGCESVALTMVLKYYKFNISKTTIASSYLPTSGSNFVTAFAGNPFSSSGAGIYAPGLTNTANKFLTKKKSKLRATDMTGISLKNLYPFIDDGVPVIVWNSMYMWNPVAVSSYYTLGKTWTFYRYEHCVVLCGYDKKKNKVLINDPLSGLVWRNASSFERIYNKLGKMAVVIR